MSNPPLNGGTRADMVTNGPYGFQRHKVDVAQTGLALGRQFRTFYEYTLNNQEEIVFKFSSPVDFILLSQSLTLDTATVRFTAEVAGIESGVFSEALPIVARNRLPSRPQPYYVPQVTVAHGGNYSGGNIVELFRLTAANATAQQSTVGGQFASERLLPAGDYYLRIDNLDNSTATGVYALSWEEL